MNEMSTGVQSVNKQITFPEVEAEVRRLINASPDFVYSAGVGNCEYVPTDLMAVGCIFGQALTNLGVDLDNHPDAFIEVDEESPYPFHAEPVQEVLSALDIPYNTAQSMWMGSIQSNQDSQTPWGQTLKIADKSFPSS